MRQAFIRFCQDDSAVSAIEYALLGSLIAVVIAGTVGTAGQQLLALFTYIRDRVVQATS